VTTLPAAATALEGDPMIIDAHAHVNAPPELYAYQANLIASRGSHGRGDAGVSDALLKEWGGRTMQTMDSVGTTAQLISPRPYSLSHASSPGRVVRWWIEAVNDSIARQASLFPGRLVGVAGLPQTMEDTPADWAAALEKSVTEYGFAGCLLNPDPAEGLGHVPPLGNEFWYPLFEKMVELDVPALIHSSGCGNGRETYSEHFISEESIAVLTLLNSDVFVRFPSLKIIVGHGGGSVPYQIGRWRAARLHPKLRQGYALNESFDDAIRRLWFDTVLHNPDSLELLIKTVGADRCVFGTEKPGSGSVPDPITGRDLDDLKPVIEEFSFLGDLERRQIFEENARGLFALPSTL
jgi:predicted TIM-barrel fold metal-dependent hydrolase